MLDRDIEEHWRTVKESYPDSIVFHEANGLVRRLFPALARDPESLQG